MNDTGALFSSRADCGIILTTTDHVDGYEIEEYLDIVCGSSVFTVDSSAEMKERLFSGTLKLAEFDLIERAKRISGANAVVGIHNNTFPFSLRNESSIIVALTGTAARLKKTNM